MKVLCEPLFQMGLSDYLKPTSLEPDPDRYAFRIGYVGGEVDRFNRLLLGKVLAEKSFESRPIHALSTQQAAGTELAIELLKMPLDAAFLSSRNRLVVAKLSGVETENRTRNLIEAVAWLKDKRVSVIYFQYQWMLDASIQRQLDV